MSRQPAVTQLFHLAEQEKAFMNLMQERYEQGTITKEQLDCYKQERVTFNAGILCRAKLTPEEFSLMHRNIVSYKKLRNVGITVNDVGRAKKQAPLSPSTLANRKQLKRSYTNSNLPTSNLKTTVKNGIHTVSYSSNGSYIASGGVDGSVRVWNAQTGVLQIELKGHIGSVRSVSFSPDSRRIVSGGDDGMVRIWNLATKKQERAINASPHIVPVASLQVHQDNHRADTSQYLNL